jgi:uncharacterized protein (UPF0332 family)
LNPREAIPLWLAKADDSLQAARDLLNAEHVGVAASRAYYAMFYAATAALLHEGKQFAKHSAVIAEFNRIFVQQGVFDAGMFKALQRAFDLRSEGDYELLPVSREEAQSATDDAALFIARVKEHLRERGNDI